MGNLERFSEQHIERLIAWVKSEEDLMQFAGSALQFPLTRAQLEISLQDPARYAYQLMERPNGEMIGYGEIFFAPAETFLGRLLIDASHRGRGWGLQLVQSLVHIVFEKFHKEEVSLYVFEWNEQAIRCYKKAGFRVEPGIQFPRHIKGQVWMVIKMKLRR